MVNSGRFFKKIVFALFLVVVLTGTSFAKDLKFTLVNKSGFTISKLFLSPSDISNWDFDREVEGNFPLGLTKETEVSVGNYEENVGFRFWNMRLIFEDGREWEFHNVDLAAIRALTVNVDGRAFDSTGKYHDFPKARTFVRPARSKSACYRPVRARARSFRRYRAAGPRRYHYRYRRLPSRIRYRGAK